MGQRHVCTFRHALRAAYRTAISAVQILVAFSNSVHNFVWSVFLSSCLSFWSFIIFLYCYMYTAFVRINFNINTQSHSPERSTVWRQ